MEKRINVLSGHITTVPTGSNGQVDIREPAVIVSSLRTPVCKVVQMIHQ
jgi:hypothetical protein